MNYRILIIAIVSVLVVAGLVYWLWPSSSPQTPNGQMSGNSNLGGYHDTVSVDGSGGPAGSASGTTGTEVDPQVAYKTLFEKLLARRVVFARVNSGDVYALYTGDVAKAKEWYPNQIDFTLGIVMVDITDDGVAEALVLDDLPGSCGAAGCPFTIYQKVGSTWKSIFATQIQSELGLANVITNGHTDLFLVQQGTAESYQTGVRRYVWDGTKYDQKELVASWDGKAFVVYGQ